MKQTKNPKGQSSFYVEVMLISLKKIVTHLVIGTVILSNFCRTIKYVCQSTLFIPAMITRVNCSSCSMIDSTYFLMISKTLKTFERIKVLHLSLSNKAETRKTKRII